VTPMKRRRPIEAIESRNRRTAECEERVRKAVAKLAKTGLPFTVEEICRRADVGKNLHLRQEAPGTDQIGPRLPEIPRSSSLAHASTSET
jgi:hypothetical protein